MATKNKNQERQPFDVFFASLDGSNLIEASAGTGKTWSITGLYLRMVVEKSLLPENILVVTFTKAATAELTGRIRQRLHEAMAYLLAKESGEIKRDSIKDIEFFHTLFESWEKELTSEEIKSRLIDALAQFDKAAILTIHSFCQRILNDYAFESGGRFDLEVLSDSDELKQIVAADFWRRHVSSFDGDSLSEDQEAWITWLIFKGDSPESWLNDIGGLIGKPYVEILKPEATKKISKTLFQDLKKAHQEAFTYWFANRNEVIADLKALMDDKLLNANSYRLANLDIYAEALDEYLVGNIKLRFKEMEGNARKFSQGEIESKLKKDKSVEKYPFFTTLQKLAELHDEYCASISEVFSVRRQELLIDLLEYLNAQLSKMKFDQGLLDFDEMLLNVYKAITGDQSKILSDVVVKQYQAALIDEFQDTDPLQLDIFETIFKETNTPLFYVGDPKQAIYSFRGADIFAYYKGAHSAKNKSTLLANYRSTPALVDSVNALFNPSGIPSFMTSEITFDWVSSKPKETLIVEKFEEAALQFVLAEGEKPFSKTSVQPLAISSTVQKIVEILDKANNGAAYFIKEDGSKRAVNPSDIAILVPTHFQAKELSHALAHQGVMSVRQGQDKVLQSEAAQTVLRLMQAVFEPGDEARVSELLADSLVGLSGPEIVQIKSNGAEWENLLEFFWQLKNVQLESGFSAMFRLWLNQKDKNGQTVAQRLVEYSEGERHLTDLMHVAEILQDRSRQQVSLKGLISWLQYALNGHGNEDEHKLRLESDTQRVKIVTLHASKGLEYNIVFCPFLWQGKTFSPSDIVSSHKKDQAIADFGSKEFGQACIQAEQEAMMEQIRLLYVALTRAVHHCFVFWANVGSRGNYYTASSALAWLLYADSSMLIDKSVNPVELLREKVAGMAAETFENGLLEFQTNANKRHPKNVRDNQASVSIEKFKEEAPTFLAREKTAGETLETSAFPTHPLKPTWLTSSFSSLTAGQHASLALEERSTHIDDVPEMEEQVEVNLLDEEEKEEGPSIFNFPRGATPGECLHSIFEDWDFSSTDKEALKVLVADKMNRFAIAKPDVRPQWYESVADAVLTTLNKKICTNKDATGFCLAQVGVEDRQAELEFLLTARGSSELISQLLADPKYQLPQSFIEASKQLTPKRIQGYLMGFIDLVFKDDQGVFHVLDWKSNYLGCQSDDYAPEIIERAMAETHYYLQALLYLVALHRYLKQVLPDYDIEKHLGSAWYVFIRGVEADSVSDGGQDPNGFYRFKPSASLILDLDAALSLSEVAA